MNESGKRVSWATRVALAVRDHPGCTAQEIAVYGDLPHPMVHKRLSELLKAGHVWREDRKERIRPCSISGKSACLWYPLEVEKKI